MTIALTHAAIFVVVFFLTYKIVVRFTGQNYEGYKLIQNSNLQLPWVRAEKERREKDIALGQSILKTKKDAFDKAKADFDAIEKEINSTTKKTPTEIQALITKKKEYILIVQKANDDYQTTLGQVMKILYEYQRFKNQQNLS
jgi:hypothetical protein